MSQKFKQIGRSFLIGMSVFGALTAVMIFALITAAR